MRQSWSVTVTRDPGRDDVWRRVGEVMRSWSRAAAVTPVGEVAWTAETATAADADALAAAVAEVGAEPLRATRTHGDDADLAVADLVGLLGVDLALDPPLVLNEADAYPPGPPCPGCGAHDAFDVAPGAVPRVDEALLDAPAPDGSRPGPRGWEAVNLPDGGLLLSARLVTALRDARVRGLETEEVQDADGRPSRRVVAVRAAVAVLVPCPRHTRVDGDPPCPVCGTARGSVVGWTWLPRSAVGDAEVVSQHPGRAAMLLLAPRASALLADVPGVHRDLPVRVCAD